MDWRCGSSTRVCYVSPSPEFKLWSHRQTNKQIKVPCKILSPQLLRESRPLLLTSPPRASSPEGSYPQLLVFIGYKRKRLPLNLLSVNSAASSCPPQYFPLRLWCWELQPSLSVLTLPWSPLSWGRGVVQHLCNNVKSTICLHGPVIPTISLLDPRYCNKYGAYLWCWCHYGTVLIT
jgi:hypothetical protein